MLKLKSVFITMSLLIPSLCLGADNDRNTILNLWLDKLESQGFSGVVAIAEGGQIIVEEARGLANEEEGIPNTVNTYFDAASIAKTLTGFAILVAEAESLLSTSDLITKFLGPMDSVKSQATVNHLATHKAGLVPKDYDLAYGADRQKFLDSVLSAPQESDPGAEFRYTNAGYSLLAAILEVASGEEWEVYVDSKVLADRLGDIYFYTERNRIEASLAHGYALRQGRESVSEGRDSLDWGAIGAAGVYARARDLVYLANVLIRQNPLPKPQTQKMFDASEEEAYGWHVDKDNAGRNRIHKGGDSVEYTSQILYFPDSDITITWMVNNNRNRWRTILRGGLVAWAHNENIPQH